METDTRAINDTESAALESITGETLPAFKEAMDDDFNTAAAIGHLFSALGNLNGVLDSADSSGGGVSAAFREGVDGFFKEIGSVLGFFENGIVAGEVWFSGSGDDDEKARAQAMAEERVQARNDKNWVRADELRDEIVELGYDLQDTPQGPVLVHRKDA
jgi:cysteinyl-tRNA synthetase